MSLNRERLVELCLLPGVSGREDAVRDYIRSAVAPTGYPCREDNLGNLLVEVKGAKTPDKKIVLSAHMDEVGFIITGIDEDGTLRFTNVGGIMPAVASGRAVFVGDGAVPGVIGAKPIHLLGADEKEKYTPLEDMRIDIGAADKAQAEKLAAPGDRVVFWSVCREMGEGAFCVKAIDDRAGCALLLELILGETLPHDCTFIFTTQEESGCVGARGAAFQVAADIAIAVEGTTAGDMTDTPDHKKVCRMGGGPVVSYMDKGTVYDAALYRQAVEEAQAAGIPWQTKELVAGGNESRSYQQTGAGSRVLAVSMPVRYLHSATSVASWQDAENTLALLRRLVGRCWE